MTSFSGGCQCGAVRFRVEADGLRGASICHCRMCQKAFGNFYAPLVGVETRALTWTRGAPKRWRSSNHVVRGFCEACGTPLTYEPDREEPALAIAAFDDPERIRPTLQYGTESELSYVAGLSALPARPSEGEVVPAASWLGDITSFQHPDRDTETWPEASP